MAAAVGRRCTRGGFFYRAGGVFAHGIAKWDGTRWAEVGDGVNDVVYALTVFDDGSGGGPALYAGGTFNYAGNVKASGVAKWNGTSWSPLDMGVNYVVYALTTYDDGSGPAIYAGGAFTTASGVTASNIAKWDGTTWTALGSGLNDNVWALAVFDDSGGGGPALYAGGYFTTAGGVTANHIAKWDGRNWSALGAGMDVDVWDFTVFDDGSGPALFAAGEFATAGGVTVNGIAKWNGTSWSPVGTGMESDVMALTVFDDGRGGGPALYAGGFFVTAGGLPVNFITKWNGVSWSAFGTGVDNWVSDLAVFDDGSGGGPALYAGGGFSAASGQEIKGVAKWNGTSWSALGTGLTLSGTVYALTVFDDGGGAGPALYVGGSFDAAGGTPAARIAAWNGTSWSALGAGLSSPPYALTGFDDGSGGGPALYAGGSFYTAGGTTVNRIAKWDGMTWSPLDGGVSGMFPGFVNAMTVFDDGSGGGPALYAGGSFDMAGGVAVNKIAKWDGTTWSPLGGGMGSGCCASVGALAVFDDGSASGPALYAGGRFNSAGGVPVNNIARWDGTNWTALGGGVEGGGVGSLTVFDDGGGPALYAGGNFTTAGGVTANRIAKWNGTSWSALDGGMISGSVGDLTVFDDGRGGGPALYAGGSFSVHDAGDDHVARWGCETSACPWDCGDRNGIVDILDFLAVLSQWGLAGTRCDIDGAGIGPKDFSNVMAHWGPCP